MNHTPTIDEGPHGFTITCPGCGEIGSADEFGMAKMLGRIHESISVSTRASPLTNP
jgi:hypothetical protein